MFIGNFLTSKHGKRLVTHLLSIEQHQWHSLHSYLARFKKKSLYMEEEKPKDRSFTIVGSLG